MRIELNKLDAAGLESGEGVEMMKQLMASDITLPEKAGNQYNPGKHRSFPHSKLPQSQLSSNFPFNPAFDSVKISCLSSLQNDFPSYNSLFDDSFSNFADDDYSSGYSPPLKLKPGYAPKPAPFPSQSYTPQPYSPPQSSYSPNPYQPQGYEPYSPEPTYAPQPYSPPNPSYVPEPYAPHKPAYSPEPSSPPKPAYSPAPYSPPAPEYHKPVGPVLLKERPYEVKSVQALPISVSESYTGFDCRQVAYPDRHYADPETGCEVTIFAKRSVRNGDFRGKARGPRLKKNKKSDEAQKNTT